MEIDYIKCGDCEELLQELKDKSINIILTSPPYNMTKRKGGYADKVKRYDEYIDWKSENEYLEWIRNIFLKFDRVLVSNGVILFNFSYSIENPSLPFKLINKLVEDTPFMIVDTIIWKKSNAIPFPANKTRLSRIWEFVFIIVRKGEENSFITNKKVKSISSKTNQKYYEVIYNYIEAKNNDESCGLNKATFSSELVSKLLNIYSSSEKDIVLDPFCGTGTTAIGCIMNNRHYIGFEISKKQVDYACNRIKSYIDNASNS